MYAIKKVVMPCLNVLVLFTSYKLVYYYCLQFKRNAVQPKGALHVTASSAKKILIMGGTRFIGIFLSRLLVKEGHQVYRFVFFHLIVFMRPNKDFLR